MDETRELIERLGYAATHDDDEAILQEARRRYAAGLSVRGLPRPHGAPPDAWWTVQRRKPTSDGTVPVYLMLRWRYPNEAGGKRARSLGRLN